MKSVISLLVTDLRDLTLSFLSQTLSFLSHTLSFLSLFHSSFFSQLYTPSNNCHINGTLLFHSFSAISFFLCYFIFLYFPLFLPIYHSFLFSSAFTPYFPLTPSIYFIILFFSVAIGLLLACGVCGVASMGVSYNFPSYDFPVEVIDEQHRGQEEELHSLIDHSILITLYFFPINSHSSFCLPPLLLSLTVFTVCTLFTSFPNFSPISLLCSLFTTTCAR